MASLRLCAVFALSVVQAQLIAPSEPTASAAPCTLGSILIWTACAAVGKPELAPAVVKVMTPLSAAVMSATYLDRFCDAVMPRSIRWLPP